MKTLVLTTLFQYPILTYFFFLSHRLAFSQVDFLFLEERMQSMMGRKPMLVSRWPWWTHSFDHLCSSLAKGSSWDMYGLAQGQRKPQHSRYSHVLFFFFYFKRKGSTCLERTCKWSFPLCKSCGFMLVDISLEIYNTIYYG